MSSNDNKSGKEPEKNQHRSRFNFSNVHFQPSDQWPTTSYSEVSQNVKTKQHHKNPGISSATIVDKNGPLIFNVAQLLRSPEGSSRSYDIEADELDLAGENNNKTRNIEGQVRFTRVRNEILVQGQLSADAIVNCVRCLNDFETRVDFELEDLYRPVIDIVTGLPLSLETEDDEEKLEIDENHLLNLGEAIRQQILVSLPMYPHCGEDCPGLYTYLDKINADVVSSTQEPGEEEETGTDAIDTRWSALKNIHLEE